MMNLHKIRIKRHSKLKQSYRGNLDEPVKEKIILFDGKRKFLGTEKVESRRYLIAFKQKYG